MQRPQVKIVLLAALLLMAATGEAAEPLSAVITGVVRDAQGAVQMGALVEVVTGTGLVGSALTDLHGKYTITNLLPGRYQVKATAALFLPATKPNLTLRSGAEAVVNLTLNTLFETSAWLPAERRRADEPGDDWKWTLRAAMNRSILRWDDSAGVPMPERQGPATHVQAAVLEGDGGFGDGGVHTVAAVDRVLGEGTAVSVRSDVGEPAGRGVPVEGGSPSVAVSTLYDRQSGLGGETKTVLSYQSHPQLVSSDGSAGLQVMHLAGAQKMQLGDLVDVEVGGMLYVVHTSGQASASQPFLRVTVHPGEKWTVGYRMATAQELQSFAGMDTVAQEMPVAVLYQGQLQTERGVHQEVALGRKLGAGVIQVAYYHDSLDRVLVSGAGALNPAEMAQGFGAEGVIADTSTGDFRMMGAGYGAQGVNIVVTEPVSHTMWMAVEYSTGAALTAKDGAAMTVASASSNLTPEAGQSATLALKGKVLHSGTQIRAAYRWQPSRMVTAVNPYAAFSDQAFFSCYLRQAIRMGHFLPSGLDATVDVTNLLAQGYRPVLTADGETLFLAQAPRTVQAGLAFTF